MNCRFRWLIYVVAVFLETVPRSGFSAKSSEESVDFLQNVISLSELPLDRLLRLKKEFLPNPNTKDNVKDEDDADQPHAEPLVGLGSSNEEQQAMPMPPMRGNNNNFRRDYGNPHQSMQSSGKASIQGIFQTSVTFLSFIAFAGYLCCVIMQIIKEKHQVPMQMAQTSRVILRAGQRISGTKRKRRKKRRTIQDDQNTKIIVPSMDDFYQLVTMFLEEDSLHEKGHSGG